MDREREDDLKRLLHSDVNADKTSSLLLPGAKARKRYSLGNSIDYALLLRSSIRCVTYYVAHMTQSGVLHNRLL